MDQFPSRMGFFVMKLMIVLFKFRILETYSSMGSKGQTFYNNLFLGLDQSLKILLSELVYLYEKWSLTRLCLACVC